MAQSKSMFSDKKISELGLSDWLVENCKTMGMETATKIQAAAIPNILNGKDVIGRAKTGSGKTAAFALPILEDLSQDPYGIFALILTPTRELACQIGDQFIALSANTGFKTAIAYGGSGYITNTGDIEDRPHILIATPGRLADLISSGMEFDVDELKYLVIDEADQLLLNKNFNDSLTTIFEPLPSTKGDNRRQTLLFSATLDKSMTEIYNILQYDPANENDQNRVQFIETSSHKLSTTSNINQTYCFIPEIAKETYLVAILTAEMKNKSVIIFFASKEYCMIMTRLLKNFNLKISELHSAMKQKKRLNELHRFRSGKTNILIATDLASRGLDIPQVEYIINFDIPRSGFEYIHRIGRCGRIDRSGTSITFVSQYDIKLIKSIERHIKYKLKLFNIKKYQKIVLNKMEKVLIIRAGIINSIETKYLIDPHHFKKDKTLRFNGKFTDPRILGKINLKNKLFDDFKNAFNNNYENDNENELKNENNRKQKFLKDLKKKEKLNKKIIKKKNMNIDRNDDDNDDNDDDIDTNMILNDEEVKLKNMEIMDSVADDKLSSVGKDYHSLLGYQSFRFGKQGNKIKKLERMHRIQKFQQKRNKMEYKRSKQQNRQPQLDLFAIIENKTRNNNNNTNDNRKQLKNRKIFKNKLKSSKSKLNKKSNIKQIKKINQKKLQKISISKSLRKKLSIKEQQKFKDKKRSWFGHDNTAWS